MAAPLTTAVVEELRNLVLAVNSGLDSLHYAAPEMQSLHIGTIQGAVDDAVEFLRERGLWE